MAAAALALAVATVLALAAGQGAADADAPAAGALAAGTTAGDAAADAAAADGEAQLAIADWLMFVTWLPPPAAMTTPSIAASATGMARGTAMRVSRPPGRRRCHADRCLVGMQSTSI
ncbi:MAG TPA: hypothetical protein VMK84_22785 [Streptosporangiaceae bacterium]|nr:hypothetical protein [Streptosporangiaceae bacterium]